MRKEKVSAQESTEKDKYIYLKLLRICTDLLIFISVNLIFLLVANQFFSILSELSCKRSITRFFTQIHSSHFNFKLSILMIARLILFVKLVQFQLSLFSLTRSFRLSYMTRLFEIVEKAVSKHEFWVLFSLSANANYVWVFLELSSDSLSIFFVLENYQSFI